MNPNTCERCGKAVAWVPTPQYPGGFWAHVRDGTEFDHFAYVPSWTADDDAYERGYGPRPR